MVTEIVNIRRFLLFDDRQQREREKEKKRGNSVDEKKVNEELF